jgi:hypothetical protein
MGKRFGKGSTGEGVTYIDQRKDGKKNVINVKKKIQPHLCYVSIIKLIAHNLKLTVTYRPLSVTNETNQLINNQYAHRLPECDAVRSGRYTMFRCNVLSPSSRLRRSRFLWYIRI